MSQQINLLNPAFRKPFDWLTAVPLASAAAVLLAAIVIAAFAARVSSDGRERGALEQEAKLKTVQGRLTTLAKQVAERKPNAQLIADLANVEAQLKVREEILAYLGNGNIGSTSGFAEYLRGFAQQVPKGLWLTGFTIGAGGSDMEIRGRMLNPASLPEYIHRLNSEKAFQGRSFAALTIQRPEEDKKTASSAVPGAAKPAFVEFVLKPNAQLPQAAGPATGLPEGLPALAEKKP